MDDMAKQFNEAMDQRIDTRADFLAKRAALSAAIRSRLELHVSTLHVSEKKQKEVAPMLEALTEQFCNNTVNAARVALQDFVFDQMGMNIPLAKIEDHLTAPFLDRFSSEALASLTTGK